ncbi:DUF4870 domain-containing protein [Rubrobacter indicoceani]|uniref:DUF4870 domain-containing protein n=1 Tax=Rubrobacter indicoceani TaxID=2051957 RepID=UPI001F096774|nr:DUF4870 domain-containing protein [Rubrobacter indicoceani]
MQQGPEDRPDYGNYGRHPEPGDESYGYRGSEHETRGMMQGKSSMSPQDEKTWSILSHLSVLTGLVGLMPFGALIVWLVYKDRSPRVGFHALQSLWYQLAWIVILIVGWSITFILSLILIGFLLIPVMAIASVVPFVHGCYAAYRVSQGVDYRYPFIADRIDGGRGRTAAR